MKCVFSPSLSSLEWITCEQPDDTQYRASQAAMRLFIGVGLTSVFYVLFSRLAKEQALKAVKERLEETYRPQLVMHLVSQVAMGVLVGASFSSPVLGAISGALYSLTTSFVETACVQACEEISEASQYKKNFIEKVTSVALSLLLFPLIPIVLIIRSVVALALTVLRLQTTALLQEVFLVGCYTALVLTTQVQLKVVGALVLTHLFTDRVIDLVDETFFLKKAMIRRLFVATFNEIGPIFFPFDWIRL